MKNKINWSRETDRLWKGTMYQPYRPFYPPDPIARIADDFKGGLTMQAVANMNGFKIGVGFRLVERMIRKYMIRFDK